MGSKRQKPRNDNENPRKKQYNIMTIMLFRCWGGKAERLTNKFLWRKQT